MSVNKETSIETANTNLRKCAKKIDKLIFAQLRRAGYIEKALKDYDTRMEIKSLRDYIDLSKHQRALMNETLEGLAALNKALEVPDGTEAHSGATGVPTVEFIVEGLFIEPGGGQRPIGKVPLAPLAERRAGAE
jgi:hypothetical protein